MPTNRALEKQVIATYAETLFEAASGTGSVDAVAGQMTDAVKTVRAHAQLRDALLETTVPAETRASIVREVFASFDPALVAVLALMAERSEFYLASSVNEQFITIAEQRRNKVTVDVTTAVELDDALRASITSKLAADMGKDVVLREHVDPGIVGGIIFGTGGRKIDASIASQLEAARVTLSSAHTGGEA